MCIAIAIKTHAGTETQRRIKEEREYGFVPEGYIFCIFICYISKKGSGSLTDNAEYEGARDQREFLYGSF